MSGEPTWWELFEKLLDTRFANSDRLYSERFAHNNKALELQAAEYERRLDALNHAHERALEVQHTFVSIDKYEDKMAAEAEARKIALERIDEKITANNKQLHTKLDDYITKAEARQVELDLTIANQKGAAEAAKAAAEKQGRDSKDLIEAQQRKINRNMTVAGLVLTAIVIISNWIGTAAAPPPDPLPVIIPTETAEDG